MHVHPGKMLLGPSKLLRDRSSSGECPIVDPSQNMQSRRSVCLQGPSIEIYRNMLRQSLKTATNQKSVLAIINLKSAILMPAGFLCSMFGSQRNVLLFKMGVLNSAKLPSSTRRPSFHLGDPLEKKRAISSSIFARKVV